MPAKIIDPIQPYFVLNTKFYHKSIPSNMPVAHFYEFCYTEQNPVINGAVPDGTTDIIFDITNGDATVSGSVKNVLEVGNFKKEHTYFGARLKPGAFKNHEKISCSELIEKSIPLKDIIKSRSEEAAEKLINSDNFKERTKIFCQVFNGMFSKTENSSILAKDIVKCIYINEGNINSEELEKIFCYSRRHLVRIFKENIGMDIKSFSRIIRFQTVLTELNRGKDKMFAEVALDHGYYDQTHFQKEFKNFSMLTPKKYMKIIQESSYNKRIIYQSKD